jgi:hypothetical protein
MMYMMPMHFWSTPKVTAYVFWSLHSDSEGPYFGYLFGILLLCIALEAVMWLRNMIHVKMYNEAVLN